MKMKYKCTVDLELKFPDAGDKEIATAKAAIEELIDGYIQDAVFNEMCGKDTDDKVIVTRELLEYVDDDNCECEQKEQEESAEQCDQTVSE